MVFSNALNANQVGVQTVSSVGAWTGSPITQFNALVGGASNSISNVAPSAISGIPLISQGVSSAPIFGTVGIEGGGTGSTSFNAFTPVVAGSTSTSALTSVVNSASSGIPLISQAGASPIFSTASVGGGGTGKVNFTPYSVVCAGITTAAAFQNVVGLGTAGQILTSAGASTLPTWQNNIGANNYVHINSGGTVAYGKTYVCTGSTGYNLSLPSPLADQTIGFLFLTTSNAVVTVSVLGAFNTGEAMTLYSDGTTFVPWVFSLAPVFMNAYISSSQTVPSGGNNDIQFNISPEATGVSYNTGTYTGTINYTGTCNFLASLNTQSSAAGTLSVALYVNGIPIANSTITQINGTQGIVLSTQIFMNTNDTFKFVITQNSAFSVNLTGSFYMNRIFNA